MKDSESIEYWKQRVAELEREIEKRNKFDNQLREKVSNSTKWFLKKFLGIRLSEKGELLSEKIKQWQSVEGEKFPFSELSQVIVAGFMRFVRVGILTFLIAIIPTFFLIIQTLLLYNQNKKFDIQNDLINRDVSLTTFEQTSRIRELLFQLPFDTLGVPLNDYEGNPLKIKAWPIPNLGIITQLSIFGKKEPQIVLEALRPLLRDKNSSVSGGALLALNHLASSDNIGDLNFEGSILDKVTLSKSTSDGIILQSANLTYCSMTGSILRGIFFNESSFDYSDLSHADLSSSEIALTSFEFADLSYCNLKNIIGYNNIKTMAGANVFGIKNPPNKFLEIATSLGAVTMSNDEWNSFKAEVQDIIGTNHQMGHAKAFELYMNERSGTDYRSWNEWKQSHNKE